MQCCIIYDSTYLKNHTGQSENLSLYTHRILTGHIKHITYTVSTSINRTNPALVCDNICVRLILFCLTSGVKGVFIYVSAFDVSCALYGCEWSCSSPTHNVSPHPPAPHRAHRPPQRAPAETPESCTDVGTLAPHRCFPSLWSVV